MQLTPKKELQREVFKLSLGFFRLDALRRNPSGQHLVKLIQQSCSGDGRQAGATPFHTGTPLTGLQNAQEHGSKITELE